MHIMLQWIIFLIYQNTTTYCFGQYIFFIWIQKSSLVKLSICKSTMTVGNQIAHKLLINWHLFLHFLNHWFKLFLYSRVYKVWLIRNNKNSVGGGWHSEALSIANILSCKDTTVKNRYECRKLHGKQLHWKLSYVSLLQTFTTLY